MSERVSPGAAGQRLAVSGGGIRRAGYAKVTAGRLGAWEHEPPAWLRKARARKRRPGPRRAGVWCCVCGTVREVRPVQQERETTGGPQPARHDPCAHRHRGRYSGGYVHRIAAAGERASGHRAAALARAAFLNAAGEPES